MSKSHITVIMPHYNQQNFLPIALKGVVGQMRGSDMFVLVDDGSDDKELTQAVYDEYAGYLCHFDAEVSVDEIEVDPGDQIYPHLIFHDRNRGSAETINTGFDKMREVRPMEPMDCVTWISSDNFMYPEWLKVLGAIMDDPAVGACYSGFDAVDIDDQGIPKGSMRYHYWPWSKQRLISQEGCFYGPSFLIRRSVWEKAGGHRGKISHDYDHWLRVEEACSEMGLEIAGIDAPLCRYGTHPQMATYRKRSEYDADAWRSIGLRRRGMEDAG